MLNRINVCCLYLLLVKSMQHSRLSLVDIIAFVECMVGKRMFAMVLLVIFFSIYHCSRIYQHLYVLLVTYFSIYHFSILFSIVRLLGINQRKNCVGRVLDIQVTQSYDSWGELTIGARNIYWNLDSIVYWYYRSSLDAVKGYSNLKFYIFSQLILGFLWMWMWDLEILRVRVLYIGIIGVRQMQLKGIQT
eukprot:TRINITY_DN2856_c0_g2_i11.p1 TRINITY_DN2856_c0_g2~~TRINITY_DN2856_c0_g2_i11.p1  ORF type:complete len:190 (-),score=5.71 TRINITY_DN2856_c0_g2_i11:175-744(-)